MLQALLWEKFHFQIEFRYAVKNLPFKRFRSIIYKA